MERISRMWRSGISLILVLCMVIGMCPVTAFATESAEEKPIYVSLGDSMTNGYGLSGYNYNGYLQVAKESYPEKFADAFGMKHIPLAMSAMRAEDLHFILEFPWQDESVVKFAESTRQWYSVDFDEDAWNSVFSTGDKYTWDRFVDSDRFNNGDYNKADFSKVEGFPGYGAGTKNVARTYQEAVAMADVISVGVGNSNMGVFLLETIMETIGFMEGDPSWIKLENAIRECDAATQTQIMNYYGQLKAKLAAADLPTELVEPLANCIVYAIVSYMLNYGGVIEAIVNLNPDVEIMIVGVMNTMNGMKFNYNGEIVDLGEYMYGGLSVLNAYLAALPTLLQADGKYAEATFFYADAPNVDVWVNRYGEDLKSNDTMRQRFITEIAGGIDSNGRYETGLVWSMMGDMISGIMEGATLTAIELNELKEYDDFGTARKAAQAMEDSDEALSYAVYTAFEDAIVESTKGATMSFEGLLALGNADSSLFAGVASNFEENIGADAAQYAGEVYEFIAGVVASELTTALKSQFGEMGVTLNDFSVTVTANQIAAVADESTVDTALNAIAESVAAQIVKAMEPVYAAGVVTQVTEGLSTLFAGITSKLTQPQKVATVEVEEKTEDTEDESETPEDEEEISENEGEEPATQDEGVETAAEDEGNEPAPAAEESTNTTSVDLNTAYRTALNVNEDAAYVAAFAADAQNQYTTLKAVLKAAMGGDAVNDDAVNAVFNQRINDTSNETVQSKLNDAATAAASIKDEYINAATAASIKQMLNEGNTSDTEVTLQQVILVNLQTNKVAKLVQDNVGNLCMLLALPETLSEALQSDEMIFGLLNMFARCLIGDGLGAHPTAAGHATLSAAVNAAYEGKHTVQKETEENLYTAAQIALELVQEYYDEAYAYAYAEADKAGYIDQAITAIDGVIAEVKKVQSMELPAGTTAAFKADVANSVKEIIETLEAAKALLTEADVLDQATLDALMATLNEAAEAIAALLAILEQAGIDVNQLAIIPTLQAAYDKLVNEVIPTILNNLCKAIKAGTDWLMEKLGDAYDELVDFITRHVEIYAPELVEFVKAWLLDNAAKLFSLMMEYGEKFVDFLWENIETIVEVLKYIIVTYGEELAKFILDNAEEILTALVDLVKEYGDKAWDMIEDVLEQLGVVVDTVKDVVADVQSAIDYLMSILDKVAPAIKDGLIEITTETAKTLNDIATSLIKLIETELKTANGVAKEKLTNLYNAAVQLKDACEKAVTDGVTAAAADIQAALAAVINATEEAVAVVSKDTADKINGLTEDAKAELNDAYIDATTDAYVSDGNSYYVALGDGTAVSQSYVDLLAAELGLTAEQYKNLAADGTVVADLEAVLKANVADIAKADLITVGFGNDTFLQKAMMDTMSGALYGEPVEYDWAAVVTEDGVPYVEEALAKVHEELVNAGLDQTIKYEFSSAVTIELNLIEVLDMLIESYAYSTVSYTVGLPEAINAIHEINPEALVVIVGMYNPMSGVVITEGDMEIAIGDYMDYLVDAAMVHSLAYSMTTGNAIYVDAPAVETGCDLGENTSAMDFITYYLGEAETANRPNENGHEYIKTQILNALDVTISSEETPAEPEPAGLWGDADADGVVDAVDASLILQYKAELITADKIQLSVCDVDGDGFVDAVDASLILQLKANLISVFPVEK